MINWEYSIPIFFYYPRLWDISKSGNLSRPGAIREQLADLESRIKFGDKESTGSEWENRKFWRRKDILVRLMFDNLVGKVEFQELRFDKCLYWIIFPSQILLTQAKRAIINLILFRSRQPKAN